MCNTGRITETESHALIKFMLFKIIYSTIPLGNLSEHPSNHLQANKKKHTHCTFALKHHQKAPKMYFICAFRMHKYSIYLFIYS